MAITTLSNPWTPELLWPLLSRVVKSTRCTFCCCIHGDPLGCPRGLPEGSVGCSSLGNGSGWVFSRLLLPVVLGSW